MEIVRIQVDGGFLDGLDLYFESGLNVIIGPRGSGKTSIIELLRFCLGAQQFSDGTKSNSTAKHVLGDGRVTVTVQDEDEQVTVSRCVADNSWTRSGDYSQPLVFSQGEIEDVALSDLGRLSLIDGLREAEQHKTFEEIETEVRRLTSQMNEIRGEIESLDLLVAGLKAAEDLLKSLELEQAKHSADMEVAERQQKKLDKITKFLSQEELKLATVERARARLTAWDKKAKELLAAKLELEPWPSAAGEDLLVEIRTDLSKAAANIRGWVARAQDKSGALIDLEHVIGAKIVEHQDEARELRKQLETVRAGAGELAKSVSNAKLNITKIQNSAKRKETKLRELTELQLERSAFLDQIEETNNRHFSERTHICANLNKTFGPLIRVRVTQAGLVTSYSNALSSSLRGTGLHYNTLVPLIVSKVSPREFVELVEGNKIEKLAEITGIQKARIEKLVAQLETEALEEVLLCKVDDRVELSLLDGKDYKTTEDLSFGQRCTVILPILLSTNRQALLIDQPEDNLDNAFIVGTLIKAIDQRKQFAQLILTSHNANIPVLGEADQVILMSSDGKRGFVKYAGDLDTYDSVEAISSVMEGGQKAFELRAQYYKSLEDDEI